MLLPTLSTLKILTFLPVCFSFSACGDNKNDSDAMKECSLACSDLRPEDKSDKITPEVISSRLHQSFHKKYFISFNYILCLNLTGAWSPSSYHCSQHLQLHQMEVYHLARRLNFLCMTQTTTFSLLPQYFSLQSVAHPTGQHHRALLWLTLRIFYPLMRLTHNVSTGYSSTLSYVIIPFLFWLSTSQVKSLPHSLLEGASYMPPSWKTSSRKHCPKTSNRTKMHQVWWSYGVLQCYISSPCTLSTLCCFTMTAIELVALGVYTFFITNACILFSSPHHLDSWQVIVR